MWTLCNMHEPFLGQCFDCIIGMARPCGILGIRKFRDISQGVFGRILSAGTRSSMFVGKQSIRRCLLAHWGQAVESIRMIMACSNAARGDAVNCDECDQTVNIGKKSHLNTKSTFIKFRSSTVTRMYFGASTCSSANNGSKAASS